MTNIHNNELVASIADRPALNIIKARKEIHVREEKPFVCPEKIWKLRK